MDTDDYVDEHSYCDPGENKTITVATEENFERPTRLHSTASATKDESHPRVKEILFVWHPQYFWAELEVEYYWNSSGTTFTCNALRYMAESNNRRSGNVIFGFGSAGVFSPRELTNDDAIQDEEWHPISGGGSVQGDSKGAYISFLYIYDRPGAADPQAQVTRTLKFVLSPPTITNPGLVWTPRPTLQGTGAARAEVKLYEAGLGNVVYATKTVSDYDRWTAPLTVSLPQADPFPMTASQSVNGVTSGWATTVNFTVLFKPVITTITGLTTGKPTVRGTGGLKNATLEIWHAGGAGGVQLTTTVQANGTWSVTAATAWPPGTHTITARQIGPVTKQSSDWADNQTFAIKPSKPTITAPPNPAAARQVLTITSVYSGTVTLKMLNEAGAQVRGIFSFTGTTRTFTPTAAWAPGTQKVKVVQTVSGVVSDPSSLATLVVKPAKPRITAPPNPATARQVLTITSVYSGTVTLKVLTEAGAEVAGTFSSSGITRTFTPASDWPVGSNKVKVIQTVGGIASDASDLATVAVKPPKPEITNPIVVRIPLPTLHGTGVAGASVKLYRHNASSVILGSDTVRTDNTWTVTLTQPLQMADPFTMTASQTLNGMTSDWAALANFAVLFKPSISSITVSADGKPTVRGTGGFEGANIDVRFQGGANAQLPATVQPDGSWSAVANTPWVPNTYTITAKLVGKVSNQSSDWADHETFVVKPPKPEITNPVIVRIPLPTLHGTGLAGATVKLYQHTVGSVILGSDTVQANNTWTVTLTQPLQMADPFTMTASQTFNGITSDWATLTLFAVLFKPSISSITVSADGKPTIRGTGGFDGANIDVRFQGGASPGLNATIQPDGSWSAVANTPWVPNTYTITAKLVGKVSNQSSDWANHETFAVKPPKPAITPPPAPAPTDQKLTVTDVYSDTATLKMINEAGADIPGAFVTTGNTSLFTPTAEWAPGPHRVKVVQTVNGVASDPSDECAFTIEQGNKPDAPRFELPPPGSKTSTRPRIKVTGQSLALMTVRRDGTETLHSQDADAAGILEFVATVPLVPGPNTLEVKQKGNGPESDWSELHRFTVKELPQSPVIDAPTPGSLSPRKPVIRGKGETRGQILLRHEDDPDNLIDSINGVASWRWTAQEPWDVGRYTIQVQQTDDGDSSPWTEPRTFEVVDALYGIGDAGPVPAQPVVSNHESVLLRVQVVSGVTGEATEGVVVEWRIAGEQAVIATIASGPDGWTDYLYTPTTAGTRIVLADLTTENQGIEITQPFEVTAL